METFAIVTKMTAIRKPVIEGSVTAHLLTQSTVMTDQVLRTFLTMKQSLTSHF